MDERFSESPFSKLIFVAMENSLNIFSPSIGCEEALRLSQSEQPLKIPSSVLERVVHCRKYLDDRVARGGKPMYGVNTGFGSLCQTVIDTGDLSLLQKNLVLSHACGMGEEIPKDIVRLMLLLKIRGLSHGKSGASQELIERLMLHLSEDALPVVYELGSLGASGDLAPVAHLSLPLLGEGELDFKGKRMSGADFLKLKGINALELKSKEGLALLNDTQFMSAFGVWCVSESKRLIEWAIKIAALSVDAFDGLVDAFHPEVHEARFHPGQARVAMRLRNYLNGSEIARSEKEHVQDPYSFRCTPQVLGASWDALEYVRSVVEREINGVTDNPMIFPDSDEVISAGNFHGQPLALALDYLAIAMAEVGSISERRTYKLVSGQRGLPAFLSDKPGLNSGMMIPQYTAASIVSRNKQLCTPASIDSIDSSNGQEDHVSMGANAAVKAYHVVNNVRMVLGIELLNASAAMRFRKGKSSEELEHLLEEYRKEVNYSGSDEYLHPLMKKSAEFLKA
jgi:histidine ammonia-lyase